MPFRIKQLFVIVPEYPYGKGEPFFHSELEYLAKEIPNIYVFTRHEFSKGEDRRYNKAIPNNVKILPIGKKITLLDKVIGSVTGIFFHGKDLIGDLHSKKLLLNTLAWKTSLMYLIHSRTIEKGIKKALKSNKIEDNAGVWYSYWTNESAFVLAKMKRLNIIRRGVSRSHGADLYEERHPMSFLPYRNFIYENLDSIITISLHGRKHLIVNNLKHSHKFKMSRIGVPVQSHAIKSNKRQNKIISLSTITPVKNMECMVEALSLWNGEPIEWHHIGAGRGDKYEKAFLTLLEKKLQNNSKVTVYLHGWISPADIITKLKEISPLVLINTSSYEGIPVSMMEAISLGIPVIGPKICGIPELLSDKKNGLLLKENTPEGVLEALNSIMDLSETEYLQFSEAAKKQQYLLFNETINFQHFKHLLEGSDYLISKYSDVLLSEIPEFKPASGIAILNIGIGNIGAIEKMLKKCGIQSDIVNFAEDINLFHTIILPGVGSFDVAMNKLRQKNLIEALKEHAAKGKRLIGICLGMQLLFEQSEEGKEAGLGLIKGTVKRFPESIEKQGFKIPHMGWNNAIANRFSEIEDTFSDGEFYFTHSFYCNPENSNEVLYKSFYGIEFCSAVKSGNVLGFQFHPEKSLKYGKKLFTELFANSKLEI
jgi:imidazole glycerol phosphate synthase glutamine amidotransferase subunit